MNGFNEMELDNYRILIRETTLTSLQKLIYAAQTLHIKVSPQIKVPTISLLFSWFLHCVDKCNSYQEYCKNILKLTCLQEEHIDMIKATWQDKGIQKAWSRSNEFQIDDCTN